MTDNLNPTLEVKQASTEIVKIKENYCAFCINAKDKKTIITEENLGLLIMNKKQSVFLCGECVEELKQDLKKNVEFNFIAKPLLMTIKKMIKIDLLSFFE